MDFPSHIDPLEQKRNEIVLRMSRRGDDHTIALETTPEGLDELERRLDDIESHEEEFTGLSQSNLISSLSSEPGQQKSHKLSLRLDGLPKDEARVNKLKIERLKKQYEEYEANLGRLKADIESLMNEDASGDRIVHLEDSKNQIESELRRIQEEITSLLKDN